ncbi:hypothetical protein GALMADRAFT_802700 [Galerina marginata CBS 339.88]|uniref:Uncharacterized protein n=1 Tax=Galerina marginata (strain CBS 339.88) TaxID=685588 RepID=A0A067STP1_GALM3|nr:hypothetical protein GALMADRAFT_802700 [Galerina marginata CBS 339.88]
MASALLLARRPCPSSHQCRLTWPKRHPTPFREPLPSSEGCGPEIRGLRRILGEGEYIRYENDPRCAAPHRIPATVSSSHPMQPRVCHHVSLSNDG